MKLVEDNFEVQWETVCNVDESDEQIIPTALLGSAIYEINLSDDLWIDRDDWLPEDYEELIWQILEYYPGSDVPFELEKPREIRDWFPTIATIWILDESSTEYPNQIQCWIEFEALDDIEWKN